MDHYRIAWTPGIGDPSITGWLTVLAYFVTAFFSFQVYQQRNYIFSSKKELQTNLWRAIAIVMLVLAFNKQLDIQTLFTEIGRYVFASFGLLEFKRVFQAMLIIVILSGGLVGCVVLFVLFRKVFRFHRLAIIGLCFLMAFILIRAASFHNMDHLIGSQIMGLHLNAIFELSGIGLVFYNSLQLIKIAKSRRKYLRAKDRAHMKAKRVRMRSRSTLKQKAH